jgi:hypothetical protein
MSEYNEMMTEDYEVDEESVLAASEHYDLQQALDALQSRAEARTSKTLLFGLSGLSASDRERFEAAWHNLDAGYRRRVLRDLLAFAEANIEMDYRQVGIAGMGDDDPAVREIAIELLWEDETLEVMNHLINVAAHDSGAAVRAAATTALGRFILLGELGDLPEQDTVAAQEIAIRLLQDPNEPVEVKRRALEAIANCSHPIVPGAIEAAYESDEHWMRVSSLYAIGRSCDERWESIVLEALETDDAEMRYEAARAAGELEIAEAVPLLGRLLLDNDREILEVVVWSLGEIGGKEAIRILEALAETAEETEDDDLMEAVEDAIGNASLADGPFGMYDFDLDES